MAFKEKKDWFGLAKEGTNLVAVGENDGATSQVIEVHDDKGSFILSTAYGETVAPSVDYKLKGVFKQAGDNAADIALGQVATTDGKAVVLVSLDISTGTGAEPTVSVSGDQVQDGAKTVWKYVIPPFELKPLHHAQILFNAFTLAGNGCHLQTANYSIACSVGKAMKDGVCLAFDVIEGVIEASITIAQVGDEKPVLTPGDGWTVSSVLACENPDAAYPTWSATLKKNLVKTEG